MASVTFSEASRVYPGMKHPAVDRLNLEIIDGEFLVLVGPSGCGKSTTLRMLAGLEPIDDGSVFIGDRDVTMVPPRDRDIAMVFQSYALYPHMTVAENLSFALQLRKLPAADIATRVGQAAEMLGLDGMLERKPAQLSGGQRQRVALGRALVRQPQVFLLDEPLSNLDAKLRAGMRAEIARIHARTGTTMIYVTHDQVEAMTLGQRIVVMKDGVVQQIDTPMALYRNPANLFVATFLGSPAMNTVEGALELDDGPMLVLADGQRVRLDGARLPAGLPRQVIAGIRPEHLAVATDGQAMLSATVDTVEPVGNEVFVNLRMGPLALVARLPPEQAPAEGESLGLTLRVPEVLFFDPASGERLPG